MAGPIVNHRRSRAGRALAFAGWLVIASAAGVSLAEPADTPSGADWQLTLRARNALWDDPTFDKLNLGVKVRQGTATLQGPVPSTAVAAQAVERLRKVPGVRVVVDESYVPPADEPLARSMPHPVTTQRPPVPTVSVAPTPPLTSTPAPHPTAPPAASAPAPVIGEPAATLLPPVAAPTRPASLAEQVEQLRLRERRFQSIRVEVRDGWVFLRGTVARSQDAWEFADAVRRLPGVERVIQSVTTAER